MIIPSLTITDMKLHHYGNDKEVVRIFSYLCRYKETFVSFSISLSIEPDYIPSINLTAELLIKLGLLSLPLARSFLMNALCDWNLLTIPLGIIP
jgi:hypothetical protein